MLDPKPAPLEPLDSLVNEFIDRVRAGQSPQVADYAERHPELADEINEVFPTIAAMEKVRRHALSGPPPLASSILLNLEQLGDYQIVKEIGRGGMGIVFLAVQKTLERQVALKVLPAQCLLDEKRLLRFLRESKTAAGLHHTNIVPVFGVGQDNGHHYFVMQFIDGLGLDDVLAIWTERPSVAPLPERGQQLVDRLTTRPLCLDPDIKQSTGPEPREVAGKAPSAFWDNVALIGAQTADALQYAHQQGVLHRDIKPGNLLIDFSGNVWIADFGLARVVEQDALSGVGEVLGTLRYMAPEQRAGDPDERSDIFALGITLYELVAKQACREQNDLLPAPFRDSVTFEQLPLLRSIDPTVPRDLEAIIAKASAPNPRLRYQTAGELAADLNRYRSGLPIRARRISAVERLVRWGARHPVAATTGAASLLLLVLVACFASFAYMREAHHRQRFEAMSDTSTEILDKIYDEFAPRRLPPEGAAGAPLPTSFASATIEQIPSTETIAVLENLLLYYDQIASQNEGQDSVILKAAEANHRIGNMQRLLGNFQAAESAFQRAIRLCGEVSAATAQSPTVKHLVAASWNELGQTHESSGQFESAQAAHATALQELQSLAETGADSALLQFELAKTLYLLDRYGLHQSIENLSAPGANQQTRDAIEILESLAQRHSSPESRLLLARCYRRLSNFEPDGLPNEADDKAQLVFNRLVAEFPQTGEYRFELAQTLNSCRMENLLVDEPEAAISRLGEARKIIDGLVKEFPQIPHYQQLRIAINRQLSFVLRPLGEMEKAEASIAEAVDGQKAFLKTFPNTDHQHLLLAKLRIELAKIQIDRQEEPLAIATLTSMRDELTPLLKSQNASSTLDARSIHQDLSKLADHLESQSKTSWAKQVREIGDSL